MTLAFPIDRFIYDPDTGMVLFMAIEGIAEMIVCGVTEQALADLEGGVASGEVVVPIFERNRAMIEAIARGKFKRGEQEPGGMVFLSSADMVRRA